MKDQDVNLGEIYSDDVTSFAGIATGQLLSLQEPSQIQLENNYGSRWIAVTRCSPASDDVKEKVTSGSFATSGAGSGTH